MNRQETYEDLCVLLEEYAGAEVETVAEQILGLLGLTGETVLENLAPPPGLQHWLISHGLSLVPTQDVTSIRVWEALEEEDEDGHLEEGPGDTPLLQVGDYVEYQTAPSGPHGQSRIGSGWITVIQPEEEGGDLVIVASSPTDENWLFTQTDVIRPSRPAPGRSAQAPSW